MSEMIEFTGSLTRDAAHRLAHDHAALNNLLLDLLGNPQQVASALTEADVALITAAVSVCGVGCERALPWTPEPGEFGVLASTAVDNSSPRRRHPLAGRRVRIVGVGEQLLIVTGANGAATAEYAVTRNAVAREVDPFEGA